MKTIQLTPKEFYVFKKIAQFKYSIKLIKHASIFIYANALDLSKIGY